MKKIILNNKGQLIQKDLDYFGGKYSFLERIKMNGIGSPKLIYKSGLTYFDEVETVENEISFANFELMKNGFLIRLHRNQKHRYVGFQLDGILTIFLQGTKDEDLEEPRRLIIVTKNHHIKFELLAQNFPSVLTFFKKKTFKGKFKME